MEEWKKEKEKEEELEASQRGGNDRWEIRSNKSGRSFRSERTVSESSEGSEDRLSVRDLWKIKRIVNKKDKEARKCNIIVRGIKVSEDKKRNRKDGQNGQRTL